MEVLAEYAVKAKIVSEPAFVWWVLFTIKRRDQIIDKIDARFAKKRHKFGIAVSISKGGTPDEQKQ